MPFARPTPTWYWPARRLRKLPRNWRIAFSTGRGDCPPRIRQSPPPRGVSGHLAKNKPATCAGLDLLTVEAVHTEPVSDTNSLHQGIYQGIFPSRAQPPARMLLIRRCLPRVHEALCAANQGIICGLSREFYRQSREHLRAAVAADSPTPGTSSRPSSRPSSGTSVATTRGRRRGNRRALSRVGAPCLPPRPRLEIPTATTPPNRGNTNSSLHLTHFS
jgi:hypothetical protein